MTSRAILTVNVGSSSVKLRLIGEDDEVLASAEPARGESLVERLPRMLDGVAAPAAVGHRVVHGGAEFVLPTLIEAAIEGQLAQLEELAPLHNPPALEAIRAVASAYPELPAVACFDTSFHHGLPAAASTYALPASWAERWPLRRFGFHGLSHARASRRAAEVLAQPIESLRIVTAHLGAGASLAAIAGGRSVDTTMGFTPLDGLVMATRSGSLDPGLLLWVQRHGRISAEEAERALESESGLLGLSGETGDMLELLALADSGDQRAANALDVYVHRLRGAIAAMTASLGGLDALVFTGGIGEHSPVIRGRVCGRLGFLGVLPLDESTGEGPSADRVISRPESSAATLVVEAREDLEIAALVRDTLDRTPGIDWRKHDPT